MAQANIGDIQRERGMKTRERVFEWYADNPCGTQKEAMAALDLSKATMGKHVAAIRDGWRPEGVE